MRIIREQLAEPALPISESGGVLQAGIDLDESAALLDSIRAARRS